MRVRFPALVTIVAVAAAWAAAGPPNPAERAATPAKPAAPAKPAPGKAKFPGPDVALLLKGWGGLTWGTTLEVFQKKHADAKKLESGRWATAAGADTLGGVKVTAEYGFNAKGQLHTVRFVPEDAAKTTFKATLVEAGVLREGDKPNWQNSGVTFAIAAVDGDQFAVALNAKFNDPPAKK